MTNHDLRARRATPFVILVLAILGARPIGAQLLTPAWVEIGPDGAAVARVIVNAPADCPSLQIDGAGRRMALRQPKCAPSQLEHFCVYSKPVLKKHIFAACGTIPIAAMF